MRSESIYSILEPLAKKAKRLESSASLTPGYRSLKSQASTPYEQGEVAMEEIFGTANELSSIKNGLIFSTVA